MGRSGRGCQRRHRSKWRHTDLVTRPKVCGLSVVALIHVVKQRRRRRRAGSVCQNRKKHEKQMAKRRENKGMKSNAKNQCRNGRKRKETGNRWKSAKGWPSLHALPWRWVVFDLEGVATARSVVRRPSFGTSSSPAKGGKGGTVGQMAPRHRDGFETFTNFRQRRRKYCDALAGQHQMQSHSSIATGGVNCCE